MKLMLITTTLRHSLSQMLSIREKQINTCRTDTSRYFATSSEIGLFFLNQPTHFYTSSAWWQALSPPGPLPHSPVSFMEMPPHLTTDSRGFAGLNSLALGFNVDFFTCLREKSRVNPHGLPLITRHPPISPPNSLGNRALILVISFDEAHRGAASLARARWWELIWPLRASC